MDIPEQRRQFGPKRVGLTRQQALTAAMATCAYPASLAQATVAPMLRIEITFITDGQRVVPTPMLATNAEQSRPGIGTVQRAGTVGRFEAAA